MSIARLDIGEKTSNQGATANGRLTAIEFNELVTCVNSLVDNANDNAGKTVYCTQEEYDALIAAGTIDDNTEYNILED